MGFGLAFAGGSGAPAQAGGDCPAGEDCSTKKPNVLIVVDYSSSMNEALTPTHTRWEAAVEAIGGLVMANNGFFDDHMHLGLMRYGHDPDPDTEGTLIFVGGQLDPSGIVDGQALDVGWYDPVNDPSGYFECSGVQVLEALEAAGPPLCVGPTCEGVESWTGGALQAARHHISQTRADHPEDETPGDERSSFVVLMTDGAWTTQVGQPPGGDPSDLADDPVAAAGDLFSSDDVPTYVIAFGDASGASFATDVANAGGTSVALGGDTAADLASALSVVVEDVDESILQQGCVGHEPRIMVIVDASSSMLNVGNPSDLDAYQAGAMGTTGWDVVGDVFSNSPSFFEIQPLGAGGATLEDLAHVGVMTFGSQDDAQLLTNYGACTSPNFEWALDPATSCGAGCADPWDGPPIIWSPQGPGSAGYPGFEQETFSTMPACNTGMADLDSCHGSFNATHTGLALANSNADQYRLDPPPSSPVSATTSFINILITDGSYGEAGWSTDEQVSTELEDMYGNDNTITFVIGLGSDDQLAPTELANMACWGSGGTGIPCTGGSVVPFIAADEAGLRDALQQIAETLEFDACCEPNSCTEEPPGGVSTDPFTSGSEASTGDGSTTEAPTTGPTSSSTGSLESTGAAPPTTGGVADSSTGNTPATGSVTTSITETSASVGGDTLGSTGEVGLDTVVLDGCSCSTREGDSGRWLGGLWGVALFGFLRRRNGPGRGHQAA